MEIETQIANVIWTIVLTVGLYFAWDRLAVPFMRDNMRQKLFQLRREMFLYMADGGISPDHLAYGMLRHRMNSSIRFADGLSLTRAIVAMIAVPDDCKAATKKLDDAINSLPNIARAKMEDFRKKSALVVGRFVLGRSPTFLLLATVAAPLFIVLFVAMLAVSLVKKAWTRSWSDMVEAAWRRADKGAEGINCLDTEEAALLAA
jgi:hypothetical protein